MERPDEQYLRREFGKIVVAIGGSSALSACSQFEQSSEEPATIPKGTTSFWTLPDRQHAWNDSLLTDSYGTHILPRHHVFLYLDYEGTVPTEADRKVVEEALKGLERAYERSSRGLLFTIGYSPSYFARFGQDTHLSGVGLPSPESITAFESPELDQQDAVLHLASNHSRVVLAAEQALFENLEKLNGEQIKTRLSDVFSRADRRSGFIGKGLPARKQRKIETLADQNPVPSAAPEFMGFRTPFPKNQPSEDQITIGQGPFAGSTTQHIERIEIDLDSWYEQSHSARVGRMFSPEHAAEDMVGKIGEQLGRFNGVTEDIASQLLSDAKKHGYIGHAQKTARARQDGTPVILRRDVDTIDGGNPGLHFLSVQSKISDFTYTRKKMAAVNLDTPSGEEIHLDQVAEIGKRENNGILEFIEPTHRGNFLLPRRDIRALPEPQPK